jgi:polyvinyl alcohol dehydrogenase (cytochrome)
MNLFKKAELLLCAGAMVAAAAPDGGDLYTKNCAQCHEVIALAAQNRALLKNLTPDYIVRALANGTMHTQGARLSAGDRAAIAEYLTGRAPGHAVEPGAGRCTSEPSKAFTGPQWNGWGAGLDNSRFQPAGTAGLTTDEVPKLKLRWAFGYPDSYSAFAQPSIAGGRVFVGSALGIVYSLDSASGCTYWSFDAGAGVRTGIMIGPGNVAYFGDLRANVYALDAVTGKLLWKTTVDDHPLSRVTGTPALYEGKLYVPVASRSEWLAADSHYECCTFRGSVLALDAKTGKQIWKTYTISERAKPLRKAKNGTQLWGPSGAGVWGSPTIDAKRNVLYAATGDNYSEPATPYSDAVLAVALDSGKIVWARQITSGDVFNGGCGQRDASNCPEKVGPDFDFGSSTILRSLPGGKRLLLAGQKSGVLHALDPDNEGKIVWQTKLGNGSILGGIQWGPAADGESAYAAISDIGFVAGPDGMLPDPKAGGGLFAVQLTTGEKLWSALPAEGGCSRPRCSPAQSAAVSVIPGVVFSGSVDGHFRAYSAKDGKIIWDYDTVRDFETVNQIPAHGGSLDGPGAAVAGGMLFVNSGYGYFFAMPGNVLLAFGVEQ